MHVLESCNSVESITAEDAERREKSIFDHGLFIMGLDFCSFG